MRTLLVVVTLASLAACSGESKPAPEAESLPTVSAATTCGALLDGKDAPMQGVVDLMRADTMPSHDDRAREFAADLERIGEQAGEETAPHIRVVVEELREFADAVEGGEGFETGTMVTSLTEINNVCGREPRF